MKSWQYLFSAQSLVLPCRVKPPNLHYRCIYAEACSESIATLRYPSLRHIATRQIGQHSYLRADVEAVANHSQRCAKFDWSVI